MNTFRSCCDLPTCSSLGYTESQVYISYACFNFAMTISLSNMAPLHLYLSPNKSASWDLLNRIGLGHEFSVALLFCRLFVCEQLLFSSPSLSCDRHSSCGFWCTVFFTLLSLIVDVHTVRCPSRCRLYCFRPTSIPFYHRNFGVV